ncbi:hypothetical protein HHX47_DHR4000608 [Lentinula edodes]|nr:hypothetical protein HHX47_DHR4000608 [Lentinula edodes]
MPPLLRQESQFFCSFMDFQAPHMLGYGGTAKPVDPHLYASSLITGDMVDLLDAEDVDEAIVIGHDWGAKVVARLANYFPERFSAFGFLSVGYFSPSVLEISYAELNNITKQAVGYEIYGYWDFFSANGTDQIIEDNLDSFFDITFTANKVLWITDFAPLGGLQAWLESNSTTAAGDFITPEDRAIQIDTMRSEGMRAALCWYEILTSTIERDDNQGIPQENLTIKKPVFLGAALEDYVAIAALEINSIIQASENATTIQQYDSGHWVMLEAKDQVNSDLLAWIESPIKPDPLDSTGLVYVLPGELVIVLKNLGKKAVKTREKALDDLESGYVARLVDPGALYAYLNPSPLRTPASAPMPHDKLTGNQKTQIHSKGAKGKTTPVKGKSTSSTPKTSAGNPDVKQLQGFDDPPLDSLETDTDRDARLRVSGLGALAWVLSASYLAETLDVLSDARLWSSLAGYDFGSFGFEQPPVRKAAWRLVGTVSGALGNFKPSVTAATQSSPSTDEKILKLLRILSFSVFHNAWTEQDAGVQGVMWQPLLRFLKDNPEAWQWEMGYNYTAEINLRMRDVDAGSDAGSDSDSESASSDGEDEDVRKGTEVPPFAASRAFKSFLSFLACGCNGSPIQAYPAVMVVLSTIPSSILLASYSSESVSSPAMPFTDLFSSFWAAVEPEHHPSSSSSGITVTSTITTPNRIFSGSGADKASKAFVEAVLDCLTFLVRRIVFQSQNATSETTADILGLSTLIRTQVKRVWVEVVGTGGATTTVDANGDPPVRKLVLRISPDVLGTSLARMLRGLRGIPGGPFYDDAWETVTQLIQDSAIEVSSTSTSIAAKDLSSFTSGVLKALQPSSVDSTDSTHSDAQQLLVTVFNIALDGCERSVTGINGSIAKGIGGLHLLTKFISTFGSESGIAAASDDVITRIDTFVVQNAYKLLSLERKEGFELLTTYLLCRDANSAARSTESSQAALTWLALLEQVVEYFHSQSGSQKAEFPVVLSYLLTLLDSLRSKRGGKVAVAKLRPIMNELDDMILEFAQDTVASGFSTLSSKLNLVRDVLLLTHHTKIAETISHPLLVPASLVKLVGMLVARFESGLRSLLGVGSEGRDQRGNQEEEKVSDSLDRMDRLLVLMEVILQLPPVNVVDSEQSKPGPSSSSYTASLPALPSTSVIPGIFLLAYALPRSSLSPQSVLATTEDETISHSRDNLCAKAQRIWESSIKLSNDVYGGARKDQPYHERIYSSVTQSLRTLLSKTNPACLYWCTAEDVVEVFEVLRNSMSLKTISLHSVTLEKNPINALLPSQDSFDVLLDRMSGAPISRSMSVVDELAGAASVFDPSSSDATSDMNDVRIYARYALALLYILSNDLGLAKGLFTASPGSWWVLRHLLVLGVYAGGTVSVPNAPNALYRNPLYHLAVLESDRAHRCREIIGKVHRIVAYIFTSAEFAEGATGEEGREWRKDVCRMLSAPNETSLSTIPSLSAFLFSIAHFSAKTDSYRDCCVLREVLSRLFQTGLGSGGRSEISEEEADLWLNYARRLSETEKGKSARAPLTGVTIMSTLVANLPSSLSSSTLAASFSFPRLERYRNELASSLLGVSPSRATSDGLRILLRLVLGTAPDVESEAEFLPVQRAVNVIKACQKWIEEGGDNDDASGEEGEQIAETGDGMEELESAMTLTFYHLAPILQNVAGGHWQFIFDVVENNIENCDFNFTKSSSASNSSLQLITLARTIRLILHKAAKKRTEHFVLEAGVDTEGKVKAQLPEELLVLLQQSVDLDIDVEKADIDGDREHEIFVYLLSWMLFFDSFVDTSMKVRMSYIEQLRSSSIIETHFIPSVLSLLNLGRGIVKAYKLDIWAVDEFYVQFYETGSFSGLQTFAAHLYYRALLTVPSLIYNWVVDCRDRQLSSTIASYTQSYFSPVLIRAELEHVKGPEAQSELVSESDENQLTVKVASGAVNEVTASYLVDEQQLEIRLRIPGDWPLHRIEIRDTKKVGVDDNRWRAWILGVQQTIWAQVRCPVKFIRV